MIVKDEISFVNMGTHCFEQISQNNILVFGCMFFEQTTLR
jgi:hypothetical protein